MTGSYTQPSRSSMTRSMSSQSSQYSPRKRAEGYRDPDGMIYCPCDEPAIELAVKKEGPTKGKLFYKCGKQEQCKFFVWDSDVHKLPIRRDEQPNKLSDKDRVYEEPRPPPRSAAARAAADRAKANHAQLPSTTTTSPTKRKASFLSDDADEIEIEDESLPCFGSPKKHRSGGEEEILDVDSKQTTPRPDAGPSFSFSTPTKKTTHQQQQRGKSTYDEIKSDPTSPFHARHASLFPETPSSVQGESQESTSNGNAIDAAIAALQAVKKEETRKERLYRAAVKERDMLRNDVVDKLKRENTELKAKVKVLEEEVEDLKIRLSK